MERKKYSTENRKWEEVRVWIGIVMTAAALALIVCSILGALDCMGIALAEEQAEERWIICRPDSFVYVREFPTKNSRSIGYLELGDRVFTDGKEKKGFIHIIRFGEGEGWICSAYAMRSEVKRWESRAWICAKGRVAVRRYPGGPRTRWMKPGDELVLYGYSDEWGVTNNGFIKMRYLEAE